MRFRGGSVRLNSTSKQDAAHKPERVLPQHLVLLEVRPTPPALVVRERVPILLKQRVDPGNAPVPGVLQIFQRQPPVLGVGLLALEPASSDTVAETRRLSRDHDDVSSRSHEDASDEVQLQ